ncbi:MAG: phosphatidylserine decarboxylase, partial [Nitrospirae bacterium]|nr:phosphatidylserine decarboxylase [Nitrospirota bacterium]
MDEHRTWVAGEGIPFIVMAGIPAVIFYTLHWFIPAVLLTLLTLFIVWFFRNPERCPPPGEEKIVSPADGKIIAIQRPCEREFVGDKGIKLSI